MFLFAEPMREAIAAAQATARARGRTIVEAGDLIAALAVRSVKLSVSADGAATGAEGQAAAHIARPSSSV